MTDTAPAALTDRRTATAVGVLFIAGTMAGISGRLVTGGSGPQGPDYLPSPRRWANASSSAPTWCSRWASRWR